MARKSIKTAAQLKAPEAALAVLEEWKRSGPGHPQRRLTTTEWRQRVAAGEEIPENTLLYKAGEDLADSGQIVLLAIDEAEGLQDGQARFVISTADVDRYEDTVAVEGWDLSRYNNVVLFGHDYRQPPVAGATDTEVVGDKLMSTANFPAKGAYPFADTIRELVVARILNSASVGFMPKLWQFDEARGGFNFLEQELYEWSIVPVPALYEAMLVEAKAAGINVDPLIEASEIVLDMEYGEEGLWVPRSVLERGLRLLCPKVEYSFDIGRAGHVELRREFTAMVELSDTSEEIPGTAENAAPAGPADALAQTLRTVLQPELDRINAALEKLQPAPVTASNTITPSEEDTIETDLTPEEIRELVREQLNHQLSGFAPATST